MGQVRVIDPILSSIVQGYQNAEFIGAALFPPVPVTQAGGQIITFGKEAFRRYNTRRAPGSATRRIDFGYAGKPYALTNHALEATVPFEHQRDASQTPGVDLATESVQLVARVLALELEIERAELATTASNYASGSTQALSGSSQWSHADSNPAKDVRDAKEAIRAKIGLYPNTLVISAPVFKALQDNPTIIDRFKYTTSASITTAMLAQYLDVDRVVVGSGVYDNGGEFADIWGRNAVLAYVAPGGSMALAGGAGVTRMAPSYGYTYTMQGHPHTRTPYQDNNAQSWVYGIGYERAPVLSGMEAGFLLTNVVAQ